MTVLTNSGGINNTAVGGFKAIGASGSNGVIGQSSGSTSAGVAGLSDTGYGIYGESTSGYGLFSGGNGRVGLLAHTSSGAPTAGTYAAGDIIRDRSGNLFACVTAELRAYGESLPGLQRLGNFTRFPHPELHFRRSHLERFKLFRLRLLQAQVRPQSLYRSA